MPLCGLVGPQLKRKPDRQLEPTAMHVPEDIRVQVHSAGTSALDGLIVQITVRAGRKNPYQILSPKTDESGCVAIIRDDFIGQFTDHWQLGLMDYDGSIETAGSDVLVDLFDPTWYLENPKLAQAWPLLKHESTKWRSRQDQYVYVTTCRNLNFTARPIRANLELGNLLSLEVTQK